MNLPNAETIASLFPRAQFPEHISDAIADTVSHFNINTPQRLASFLAQIGHESAGLTQFSENLNYRAAALLATFPTHFDASSASAYEHRPEAIANRVYANRMGNGDEASGDGFKYRGRGAIQLTGKSNYDTAGQDIGPDFIANPDQVAGMPHAISTAGWFWNTHNLNSLADSEDQKGICKKVNGGYLGLDDRVALYNKILPLVS